MKKLILLKLNNAFHGGVMRKIGVLFFTTCLTASAFACTVITSISGTLDAGDPTYNRIFGSGTPPSCTFSGSGVGVYYDVYPFTVDVAGSYTFDCTFLGNDGTSAMYIGSFDPNDPCTNLIAYNDDGGVGLSPLIQATLEIDQVYILVTSTFGTGDTGDYSWAISSPQGANVYDGTLITWYKDSDNDGFSDGINQADCDRPVGYKTSAELNGHINDDCDDSDANKFPGQIWYEDADNDGYTNGATVLGCQRPSGHKFVDELVNTADIDCDDTDISINHGAMEVCNGIDDNCDGQIDEGATGGGLTHVGNVVFYNQAALDAWSPCVSTIIGSVIISGAGIVDLTPLQYITTITGNLTIQHTGLSNMNGFESLNNIGGTLTIFFNSTLTSLAGLENLTTVGASYYMYYNFQLNSCCPIHDLINGGVAGPIVIYFNKAGCNSMAEINNTCLPLPLVTINNGQTFGINTASLVNGGEMSLSPNPAIQEVNVLFDRTAPTATLRISDMLGRVVYEMEMEEGMDRLTIDLNGGPFENGLYLVSLYENGVMTTRQLVVQK